MDELKWYENLTYNEAKGILQEKMENMKQNFIAAGYYLKYIRDNKLYLEDGYQTVWEFAEDNYGIKMSTASRWMSMNDKFSDGGNSPCLAEQYKEFGKSQLQEMLYLTDDQMEQVAPEMSAKEIRAIRKPEEPVVPAQEEPQQENEIISHVELRKPDECERKYFECLAEHLILSLHDWFLEDYTNRVLMVNNSPGELKGRLGKDHRTWHFSTETGTAHANLFDEYVQLWDEKSNFMGNYEWFYLAAAIQSTWNSVALARAEADREEQKACLENESVAPAQKVDESATCPPGVKECIRQEWGMTESQQKAGAEECKKCWAKYKKYKKPEESSEHDVDAVNEEPIEIEQVEDVEVNQDEENDIDQLALVRRMLARENEELEEYIKVNKVDPLPERMLEEKKIIVAALAGMLCDLEDQEDILEPTQPPLPIMKNNDKRKEWLRNYKDWGLWYEDQNIDCRYYKYDFQDGSRLIVAEYPQRRKYWNHTELADEAYYHLLDKNKKWYGTNKTFEQQYMHSPDSETSLVEFLKILQKGEK